MKRLFFSIDFPERIIETLVDTFQAIQGTRWVSEDNLHCTLRFCGDSPPNQEVQLIHNTEKIHFSPFQLRLKGVGQFPPRGDARILWVGSEPCEPLTQLQRRIELACTSSGYKEEKRKFFPHVTVARVFHAPIDRIARFHCTNSLFSTEPFEVNSFHLYSSILGKSGAYYIKEATFSSSH